MQVKAISMLFTKDKPSLQHQERMVCYPADAGIYVLTHLLQRSSTLPGITTTNGLPSMLRFLIPRQSSKDSEHNSAVCPKFRIRQSLKSGKKEQ